ncbi:hypothetical protein BS78_10G278700 [Paspalum vaginatum]|nr:hypothetical protein BS78_10G278700 [Paspalum vaginatum]KAJ1261051.1 hypothetical protein BS78_10G278700 [Paspalum vaginatum]KAJ1261052.1 hypothetical protein BS78_10G278700 [Paspalum vaginatum]
MHLYSGSSLGQTLGPPLLPAMAMAPPPVGALCAAVIKSTFRPHIHLPHLAAAPSLLTAVLGYLSPLPFTALAFFRALLPPHPLDASLALLRLLAPHLPHHPAAQALLRDLALQHPLSSPLLLPSLLADGPPIPVGSSSSSPSLRAPTMPCGCSIRCAHARAASPPMLTPTVCTALLTALAKARMAASACKVFEEMAKPGFAINTHVYNAMLHVCLKAGDAARVEALLRKLCEDGKMKGVNRLLNEMDGRKVKTDHMPCNILINAYCKRGNMDSACKVKKKVMESGLQLDQSTYKATIHVFCKAKQLDEAKEALFQMANAGFSPNYTIFSWLVDLPEEQCRCCATHPR